VHAVAVAGHHVGRVGGERDLRAVVGDTEGLERGVVPVGATGGDADPADRAAAGEHGEHRHDGDEPPPHHGDAGKPVRRV
jgi:hypothetical protein